MEYCFEQNDSGSYIAPLSEEHEMRKIFERCITDDLLKNKSTDVISLQVCTD
jgi:hypothetical protein